MRWRYGVLVAVFLALLSMYPQAALILERGSDYNGATFVNDNDESVYIAYLQALIDGRPRKNNIYAGNTDESSETFLSIQALPAYLAANPARFVGLSAESSFLVLSVLSAVAASLCLFWFFSRVCGNPAFAAVATLFVLVMGVSVAGYGTLKQILGINPASASLPFLRRYTPGIAFPAVFLLCGSVWLAYQTSDHRRKILYAVGASLCFGGLVYSYFYLWTAVFAWLTALFLLTIVLKVDHWKIHVKRFWLPAMLLCMAIGIPYFALLSQRVESIDGAQALENTHALVISRPSIWLGGLILFTIILLARTGRIALNRPITLFIISFALLPVIVFNQQVLTGYSLQPFHYNLYVAPYAVLISVALLGWELCEKWCLKLKPAIWPALALLICVWGIIESHQAMRYRLAANIARDKAMPVGRRLAEIGKRDFNSSTSQITFNADAFQGDNQPAIAPQGVLWSEHLPWVSTLSKAEARRRYYLYLYYLNRDATYLSQSLRQCPGGAECKALFGWRVIPTLSIGQNTPNAYEIEEVIGEFTQFLQYVERNSIPDPAIHYVVVPESTAFDFARIDKWYVRDGGETQGSYKLYKLEPRGGNH